MKKRFFLKKPGFILSLLFCFLFGFSCSPETPANENSFVSIDWDNAKFEISAGLNIGGWLSQTLTRSQTHEAFFNRSMVDKLAEWGFDHIRLPVDEMEIFTENGEWKAKELKLMHNAIEWCKNKNIRVVLDFHILRSHYFNDTENITLWKSAAEQEKFVELWEKISAEFKQYPNSLLAYELLNEPVPPTPDDWNNLLERLISALRELEPERMIVLDPSSHSSIGQLKNLRLPQGDMNIMLSVHFYTPHLLTHYQAPWMDGLKNLSIPLHYPGQLVAQEDYDTITIQRHKDVVRYYNGYYDKSVLKARLQEAIDFGNQTGLQIHIGEIGCIDKTPADVRNNWFSDVIAIFKENNIAFSIWGYKANLGILNDYGTPKDKDLIDIITASYP